MSARDNSSENLNAAQRHSELLLEIRGLTVTSHSREGVQIAVGTGHDFRSLNLSDAETMRLVAVLRLAVADEQR